LSPSLEKALMTLLKTVIILLAGAGIYFFVQYFWPSPLFFNLRKNPLLEGEKSVGFFYSSIIASFGQTSMHVPQSSHFSMSIV
jgi:ABC-type phosphate transport system auxiliary subunit